MKTNIKISNPSLEGNQATQLASDVSIGGTTLTTIGLTGFPVAATATNTTYYFVLIGNYGEDKSEIRTVSNSDDTVLTIDALKHSHSASERITYIPYDKIEFYGRTTSGGANNLLVTKDIDTSQQFTSYENTDSMYGYFVSKYYKSIVDITESDESEEINGTSFTYFSAKKIIESGLVKAITRVDENPNGILSWNVLIDFINQGLLEIINYKRQWSFLNTVQTGLHNTAGVAYMNKPNDCSVIEFLKYNGNKIDFITRMRYDQYSYGNETLAGIPSYYTLKNDKIYFYPISGSTDNVTINYFKYPTTITSLAQEVPKPFATMLSYYIAAHASWARSNDKRGDKYFGLFTIQLKNAIEEYTGPIQVGDSQSAEISTSSFDDLIF